MATVRCCLASIDRGMNMQADEHTDEQVKSRAGSALREMVETILLTLLIYVLIRTFLIENYRVLGHSMVPTLEDEQFLIVSKLDYRLREPERGDIVVFFDPRNEDRKLIKRIIGLPGEMVEIRSGQVFVDGQALDEPYVKNQAGYNEPAERVPDGQFYVLGDNRANSSDSHNWGTLLEEKIVGRAWFSYWPPELWGPIHHAEYAWAP
jgi:signal peptidase I